MNLQHCYSDLSKIGPLCWIFKLKISSAYIFLINSPNYKIWFISYPTEIEIQPCNDHRKKHSIAAPPVERSKPISNQHSFLLISILHIKCCEITYHRIDMPIHSYYGNREKHGNYRYFWEDIHLNLISTNILSQSDSI